MAAIKKLQLSLAAALVIAAMSLGLWSMIPATQADDGPQEKAKQEYSDPELARDNELLQGYWSLRCQFTNETLYPASGLQNYMMISGSSIGGVTPLFGERIHQSFKLEKTEAGKVMTHSQEGVVMGRSLYSISGDLLVQTTTRGKPGAALPNRIAAAGDQQTWTLIYQRLTPQEVEKIRSQDGGPARHQVARELRQLAIAFHDFHSDYDHLPPAAIFDHKSGKPLLSWRVAILPYVKEGQLSKEFKLDEPWDSPHNKKLLSKMPKIFHHPQDQREQGHGMTHYQLFVGPAKQTQDRSYVFTPMFSLDPSFKLNLGRLAVADGTAHTMMIAEARGAVPWTQPVDMYIEHDAAPLPELGVAAEGDDFLTVFADGSVHRFKRRLAEKEKSDKILRQLIGYKDGFSLDARPMMK